MEFDGRQVMLTEQEASMSPVVSLFGVGLRSVNVSISVCEQSRGGVDACDAISMIENVGNVTILVQPSTTRLFPYGAVTGDQSFRGILDGAVAIYPPESIPFYANYYRSLYVRRQIAFAIHSIVNYVANYSNPDNLLTISCEHLKLNWY